MTHSGEKSRRGMTGGSIAFVCASAGDRSLRGKLAQPELLSVYCSIETEAKQQ